MRLWCKSGLVFLLLQLSVLCHAQPEFPTLTGRVVDNAGLLSSSTRQQLIQQLAAHEQQTTNQVVIVTLQSLDGYDIAQYGYQLGRHWGIGQKDKDNGVLLIVAPNERKVRIEVGYGLEGQLTDALSHNIIQTRILPRFRKGQFEEGIVDGTQGILAVLGGTYEPVKIKTGKKSQSADNFIGALIFIMITSVVIGNLVLGRFIKSQMKVSGIIAAIAFVLGWFITSTIIGAVIFALVILVFSIFNGRGPGGRGGYSGGGYYGGGYSSGGYSGGGFSGGGGSFGGGGASGGW